MQPINATHWQKIHRVVDSMGLTNFMHASASATITVAPTIHEEKSNKGKKPKSHGKIYYQRQ